MFSHNLFSFFCSYDLSRRNDHFVVLWTVSWTQESLTALIDVYLLPFKMHMLLVCIYEYHSKSFVSTRLMDNSQKQMTSSSFLSRLNLNSIILYYKWFWKIANVHFHFKWFPYLQHSLIILWFFFFCSRSNTTTTEMHSRARFFYPFVHKSLNWNLNTF